MSIVLWAVIYLLALFAAWSILRLIWSGVVAYYLARRTRMLSVEIPGADRRIAVVGDSTVYGVGATDTAHSIVGRMAKDFPNVHIDNWSECSRGLSWAARTLESRAGLANARTYDLVIIMTGGINIICGVPARVMRHNLSRAVQNAKKISRNVIIVAPNNVGLAPIINFPLTHLYAHLSRRTHELFKETAKKEGVHFVSLFQEREDCLSADPKRLRALDRTHPSDDGYPLR